MLPGGEGTAADQARHCLRTPRDDDRPQHHARSHSSLCEGARRFRCRRCRGAGSADKADGVRHVWVAGLSAHLCMVLPGDVLELLKNLRDGKPK
eukprot:395040-Rhodomonas_salina.2